MNNDIIFKHIYYNLLKIYKILIKYNEKEFSKKIFQIIIKAEKKDITFQNDFLKLCIGGMGSLNDLVISEMNNHNICIYDEKEISCKVSDLKNGILNLIRYSQTNL